MFIIYKTTMHYVGLVLTAQAYFLVLKDKV